jgi:hypothetical protein
VAAVMQFPQPKTNKQLLSFLGMLNFYRRLLPKAVMVLKPLTDSLRGAAATAAVEWTEEKNAAFEAAKRLLAGAACLAHPEPQSQLCLAVDASDSHIGGVLQQSSSLGWHLISLRSWRAPKLDIQRLTGSFWRATRPYGIFAGLWMVEFFTS